MATVKHLYTGHGNPNDNPELELTGDAVGNHLYQDLNNGQAVWISTTYEDEGQIYHYEWHRMILAANLDLYEVEYSNPSFAGETGYSSAGEMFVAMHDDADGGILKWRSMGTSLGGWL